MNKAALVLLVAMLPACAGAVTTADPMPMNSELPGVLTQVEGVDIWSDSIPDRRFTVVQRNVPLTLDPVTVEGSGQTAVFPAIRMSAVAAAVRAAGGDAAIVRTRVIDAPASGSGALFGTYAYEVDAIRYGS